MLTVRKGRPAPALLAWRGSKPNRLGAGRGERISGQVMMMRRWVEMQRDLAVQLAAAGVIWWQGVAAVSRWALPRTARSGRGQRLVSLTSAGDTQHVHARDAVAEDPQFWQDLVSDAEAVSAEDLAQAKPVRRLVRLTHGETIEMKLAHRHEQQRDHGGPEAVTGFFRFEDAAGPLGFAAIEQYGREGILRSVLLLQHRRGTGAGSEMVSQVLDAASALGITRLWLLTETADVFFAKLGFRPAERSAAPKRVAASHEFRSIPQTAICMVMNLAKATRG